MGKIVWDNKLSVKIKEIDELQKKMFALFNVLIDLKNKNAGRKECSNMISEINEYAKYFFSKEEEYLKKVKYPDFDIHAKEHRNFIKIIIILRRQVSDNKENLSNDAIKSLRNWLIEHILSHDLLYVPFLRINNYIESCKIKK